MQGAIDPPTFTLFVNREVPQHYLRYIERTIREEFGLGATRDQDACSQAAVTSNITRNRFQHERTD